MKKKNYWKGFAALAGGVLLLGIVAAGKLLRDDKTEEYSPKPIELSFFLRKRETTHIFETIVEEFNQSQDEVLVRTVIVPNPDVELKMRAINGEFPDIIELIGSSGENIRQYVKGGYLAPLNDARFLERIMEGYEKYLTVDGKIYMLPLSINFKGLFLNCDLLEHAGYEIPGCYEELQTLLKDIKAKGEQAMIFPDKDLWTVPQGWDAIYTAEWGNKMDAYRTAAEGICSLQDNKGFQESFEKYLDLRRFGQEKSWETSYDEAISKFAAGEAYMFLQGNWVYSAIKKQNPDIRLVFVPFPTEQGKETELFVKLDSSIAVSASCENPEAVGSFFEYLLSEDVMNYYTESTGAYSCIKGGNGDLSFAQEFVEKLEKNEFVLDMETVPNSVNEVRNQGLLKLIIGQDPDYSITDFLMEINEAVEMCKEEILDNMKWE